MAAVAKTMVNASKLRVMGINRTPHGVKLSIKPTKGNRAKLIPILREIRSTVSMFPLLVFMGRFEGKIIFMNT